MEQGPWLRFRGLVYALFSLVSQKNSICQLKASQHGPRNPTLSTLRTASKNGASRSSGGHYSTRKYATKAPGQSSNVPEDPKDVAWLNYLETVSRAPWLPLTPRNQEDILKRSYFLVFHMFLYLTRPMSKDPEEDKAAVRNFLLVRVFIFVLPTGT